MSQSFREPIEAQCGLHSHVGLLAPGADAHAATAYSPSIDVLGSYFPAWLLCIVVGVVFTIVARLLFIAGSSIRTCSGADRLFPAHCSLRDDGVAIFFQN